MLAATDRERSLIKPKRESDVSPGDGGVIGEGFEPQLHDGRPDRLLVESLEQIARDDICGHSVPCVHLLRRDPLAGAFRAPVE